jgi:hypothetical protein
MHAMTDIRAKIARATDHINSLLRETDGFFRGSPYKIITRLEPGTSTYSLTAEQPNELPTIIPVLVGEALGNLRSALDHLTWHLALLESSSPSVGTEFPVFTDDRRYRDQRNRKIGDLSRAAKALIDDEQPFQNATPEEHPLQILHGLTNIDKHRLLHIVVTAVTGVFVHPEGLPDGAQIQIQWKFEPVLNGAIFATATLSGVANPPAELDLSFPFEFCFPFTAGKPVRTVGSTLSQSMRTVQAIVAKFEHFFR